MKVQIDNFSYFKTEPHYILRHIMTDTDLNSSESASQYTTLRKASASNLDLAKEEIICPMCMGVFNTPRSLQCLHSYCETCIECLLKSSNDGSSMVCPECRAPTLLPENGVEGLPINFKLQRFVEILSNQDKLDILSRSASAKLARMISIQAPEEQESTAEYKCPIHEDKLLEYYCEQCKTLACGKCMLDKHRLHEGVQYAVEAVPLHITAMKTSLVSVESTLCISRSFLDTLSTENTGFKQEAEEAAMTVKSYFENIHKLLQERETSVLKEIADQVSKRENTIAKQRQSVLEAMAELQKCVEFVKHIEDNREADISVLQEEASIRARVEHHKSHLELAIANVKVQGSQIFRSPFYVDSTFEAQCKNLGENPYQRPLPAIPPQSYAMYNHMAPALPQRSQSAKSLSVDSLTSSTSSISTISPSHMRLSTRSSMPYFMESHTEEPDRSSGSYENDEDMDLYVDMARVYTTLPSLVITSKQLLGSSPRMSSVYPNGVCVGKPDSLIVADSRNGILRILTPTGKCLESVVVESKKDGNMVEPTALITDAEGAIYMLIRGTKNKIQKYSASGQYLSKIGKGRFLGDPKGLTVLPNGNVLVADSLKCCVHIYDPAGKYLGILEIGEGHQPDNPSDITHDHRGNIIISDSGKNCIWVYTSNGRFVTKFGQRGIDPGDLLEPYGIATDLSGNIFVAESGNHRISIFTLRGAFIRCFGRKGVDPGQFLYPRHLCVDSQGRLVVADEQNQRLQIFNIKKLLP